MGIEEFLLDRAYKEGFEKGYKESREIGKKEVNKEIAIKMREHNLAIKLIANCTGLSIKEIKDLS
jgi:predicted transposase/invertase (TIGR01784 family)